ncbi:hypothetical protein AAG906_017226 [Vitis piasezkii]
MERSKSVATPLVVNEKLSNNEVNIKADASVYRSLIGSLLYLSATRPDLMFSASLLSRFMHSPSKIHFGVAKRVLRYIRGTFDYGLWFVKKESKELQGYANSDWAGSLDDSKSTSGYAFSFGKVVAQSSAEAEYISAAAAANQAIWLRKLLTDLGQSQADATVIWVDNKSAIAIAKNPVQHGRTKHINVKFHAIREAEKNGEVNLVHCCSENQIADILTKALSKAKFEELRSRLGVSKKILKEDYWQSKGSGIRSDLQQKTYGFSNGALNGGLIGNNMQLIWMNAADPSGSANSCNTVTPAESMMNTQEFESTCSNLLHRKMGRKTLSIEAAYRIIDSTGRGPISCAKNTSNSMSFLIRYKSRTLSSSKRSSIPETVQAEPVAGTAVAASGAIAIPPEYDIESDAPKEVNQLASASIDLDSNHGIIGAYNSERLVSSPSHYFPEPGVPLEQVLEVQADDISVGYLHADEARLNPSNPQSTCFDASLKSCPKESLSKPLVSEVPLQSAGKKLERPKPAVYPSEPSSV